MRAVACSPDVADVPLPRGWTKHVQVALLHVISLAHLALTEARGRAWQSQEQAVIDGAEREAARTEIARNRSAGGVETGATWLTQPAP